MSDWTSAGIFWSAIIPDLERVSGPHGRWRDGCAAVCLEALKLRKKFPLGISKGSEDALKAEH